MNCYVDCELCGDYYDCEIRKSENPDKEDIEKEDIENEEYKNQMDTAYLSLKPLKS